MGADHQPQAAADHVRFDMWTQPHPTGKLEPSEVTADADRRRLAIRWGEPPPPGRQERPHPGDRARARRNAP